MYDNSNKKKKKKTKNGLFWNPNHYCITLIIFMTKTKGKKTQQNWKQFRWSENVEVSIHFFYPFHATNAIKKQLILVCMQNTDKNVSLNQNHVSGLWGSWKAILI